MRVAWIQRLSIELPALTISRETRPKQSSSLHATWGTNDDVYAGKVPQSGRRMRAGRGASEFPCIPGGHADGRPHLAGTSRRAGAETPIGQGRLRRLFVGQIRPACLFSVKSSGRLETARWEFAG